MKFSKPVFVEPSSLRFSRDGKNIIVNFTTANGNYAISLTINYLIAMLKNSPVKNDEVA